MVLCSFGRATTTRATSRRIRLVAAVGLYAAGVVAVPLWAARDAGSGDPGSADPRPVATPGDDPGDPTEGAEDPRAPVRALAGIWWRYEPGGEGDPVRFYYFHGDGKGLYRYGRIGHTNTNSFDYDVAGSELVLRFRKTGDDHGIGFRVESAPGPDGQARQWLVLEEDPREGGRTTRYYRERPGPIEDHAAGFDDVSSGGDDLGPPPAGHMWIDHRRYATGGSGFHFYQLRPAGIDGRGVGWYHRGDFDDWSTESLVYRITGDRLELWFPLTGEHAATSFSIEGQGDERRLHLESDPRDFWHPHDLRDAGPSFGMAAEPLQPVTSEALLAAPPA